MFIINDIEKKVDNVSEVLKCLSHRGRLLILCSLLSEKKNVNQVAIASNLSQSQTSQYLNALYLKNILKKEKKGKEIFYSIKDQKIEELINSLYQIFCKENQ